MRRNLIAGSCLGGYALAAEAGQTCRTSHSIVGACFNVRGALYVSDDKPSVHIRASGAGRLYDVLDRQAQAQSNEIVPAEVNTLMASDPTSTNVEGLFRLCPFQKDRSGKTLAVCIDSATDLAARRK